jgi:hypothetical protein
VGTGQLGQHVTGPHELGLVSREPSIVLSDPGFPVHLDERPLCGVRQSPELRVTVHVDGERHVQA